jgi:hypothetical protein
MSASRISASVIPWFMASPFSVRRHITTSESPAERLRWIKDRRAHPCNDFMVGPFAIHRVGDLRK